MVNRDFNNILNQSEKFRGNPPSYTRVKAYLGCMNICNVVDLGFIGNRFTWINCRFSRQLIRERLDRAWANLDWKLIFPELAIFHLLQTHFDHCPIHFDHCHILLDLNPNQSRHGPRPIQLEKFWVDHLEFQLLIQHIWADNNSSTSYCLHQTMQKAKAWSIATFGNIFKEKRKLLVRLEGIQKSSDSDSSPFMAIGKESTSRV
ncbi:hypothetical protein SLA2020_046790 [Shorea laevis]